MAVAGQLLLLPLSCLAALAHHPRRPFSALPERNEQRPRLYIENGTGQHPLHGPDSPGRTAPPTPSAARPSRRAGIGTIESTLTSRAFQMAPAVPRINPCGNLPPRPVSASVLIVKLAAIGDVAMALPMVTAMRQRDPGARVAWLAGATVAPLLRAVEGVDEVLVVDDNAILAGTRARKMQAVLGAWRLLSGRSFDLVLTAHTDHRYKLLTARVRATERRWLGERAQRPGLVPGRSFRAEYVRLVTGTDDRHAAVAAAPPVRATLDDAVGARLAASPPGRRIALAPGGARNAARESPLRRWPLDRYAALAAALVARGDTVVVTGGPDDDWVRPAFAGTRSSTRRRDVAAGPRRAVRRLRRRRRPRFGPAASRASRVDARRGPVRADVAGGVPARGCAHRGAVACGRPALRALLRRARVRRLQRQPLPAAHRRPRRARAPRHAAGGVSAMRVALVHDWLDTWGGGENVLVELLRLYPGADVYTLVDFLAPADRAHLPGARIRTSVLQALPRAQRLFRYAAVLWPQVIERFDLSSYDLVVSDSHASPRARARGPGRPTSATATRRRVSRGR